MSATVYRTGWVLWLLAAITAEMTHWIKEANVGIALMAFLVFWELLAIMNPGKGDTFSEFNWRFLKGGWARGILVAGVTVWLGVRFYQIGNPPVMEFVLGFDPGRMALAVGLVGWLMLHFLLGGKKG